MKQYQYYLFSVVQVDVAVVEVGIGGTYDSTNVIESVYNMYFSCTHLVYISSQFTNCMCSH